MQCSDLAPLRAAGCRPGGARRPLPLTAVARSRSAGRVLLLVALLTIWIAVIFAVSRTTPIAQDRLRPGASQPRSGASGAAPAASGPRALDDRRRATR